MANGYNHIFDKLVQDDGDFVGMVAYTVYKRQKVEWLKRFEQDHFRIPNDDEVEAGFSRFSNMQSQLDGYREQALDLLDNFLDFALAEQIEEARNEIRDDAIVKAVKTPFWTGVGHNLAAGFAASFITLAGAGLVWVASKGPENLFREALQNYLNGSARETGPPSQ
ncbi:hypothetical protein [Aromatoleum anaerobium]|uniref:Uncharacterized protein n=1 Tax=Aromatoleum anaerobium TaxID=182180 RepID=A0ABX1PLX5_9RHOO|nr:hypothetical protein [Aromatoleum anaerobium]MCK0506346.1 hypothetical protein [Aromatoleum anaerobium]